MSDEIPADTSAVILARMEVKLDHALANVTDHETRIRVLERKVWGAAGIAAGASSAISAALALVLGGGN